MSTYPETEPYGACDEEVDTTSGLYLGALTSNPITTTVGTYYWNTTLNVFRVWDDNQWNDINPIQFDGVVNGGSVTRIDTIQVRGDTAANWNISNLVLLDREIGLETDTGYIKFGVTGIAWNNLPYQATPSTRITGFENVENTSDDDKPISSATAAALNGKEDAITEGNVSQYYRGDKSWQILDKSTVGLSNVDNTADIYKPISQDTQLALNGKENVVSTGTTSQFYRGDKTWQTLTKSGVGLSNVDNVSDIDKPVSTLQAEANTLVLNTAKEYTDDSIIGLFKDMGSYNPAITNQFPTGTIKQGYVYIYSGEGTQGSVTVYPGDQVRALIDDPEQNELNWLITPKFDPSTKPYIISISPVYGRPLANAICVSHEFVLKVDFPIGLTGSKAIVKVNKKATNTATFIIKKNDIQIGTIVFTNASTQGTFTFTNAVTFNIEDVLDVYAPSPADPTLADTIISLYGTR